MIRILNSKDKVKFVEYCKEYIDTFEDNYITINRERKFFSEKGIALSLFHNIMKHGDMCFIKENNNKITGMIIIVGFSDRFPRKYVKCISDSLKDSKDLFDFLIMNYNDRQLFMKIKKSNPICNIITRFKFEECAFRGRELLFIKNREN